MTEVGGPTIPEPSRMTYRGKDKLLLDALLILLFLCSRVAVVFHFFLTIHPFPCPVVDGYAVVEFQKSFSTRSFGGFRFGHLCSASRSTAPLPCLASPRLCFRSVLNPFNAQHTVQYSTASCISMGMAHIF